MTINFLHKASYLLTFCLCVYVLIIACFAIMAPKYSIELHSLTGQSMQPTHYEGDAIIVDTNVSIDDLDTGDIITFDTPNQSICHRVFYIESHNGVKSAITKGDHNQVADVIPVTDENLTGKCIFHIPHAAKLLYIPIYFFVLLTIISDILAYGILIAKETIEKEYAVIERDYLIFKQNQKQRNSSKTTILNRIFTR